MGARHPGPPARDLPVREAGVRRRVGDSAKASPVSCPEASPAYSARTRRRVPSPTAHPRAPTLSHPARAQLASSVRPGQATNWSRSPRPCGSPAARHTLRERRQTTCPQSPAAASPRVGTPAAWSTSVSPLPASSAAHGSPSGTSFRSTSGDRPAHSPCRARGHSPAPPARPAAADRTPRSPLQTGSSPPCEEATGEPRTIPALSRPSCAPSPPPPPTLRRSCGLPPPACHAAPINPRSLTSSSVAAQNRRRTLPRCSACPPSPPRPTTPSGPPPPLRPRATGPSHPAPLVRSGATGTLNWGP